MTSDRSAGYGKPPRTTRFRKGQSGNPKGRPKGSRREIPHDKVLGQLVTVKEGGREKRMSAAEAFLLQLTQRGLAGHSSSTRMALDVIAKARELKARLFPEPILIKVHFVRTAIENTIADLGIVTNKYTTDESRVRAEINPWIVEKALARLDWIGLSEEEQRIVWDATRTPHKVKWPKWWTYVPE